MLRIRRTEALGLPRPFVELQGQWDGGELLVFLITGPGLIWPSNAFTPNPEFDGLPGLESWLLDKFAAYGAEGDLASAAHAVTEAVAVWVTSAQRDKSGVSDLGVH